MGKMHKVQPISIIPAFLLTLFHNSNLINEHGATSYNCCFCLFIYYPL